MTVPVIKEVNEQTRTYYFPNFQRFTIEEVIGFADSTTTHRLEDKHGQKWIVPKTFLAIKVETEEWSL